MNQARRSTEAIPRRVVIRRWVRRYSWLGWVVLGVAIPAMELIRPSKPAPPSEIVFILLRDLVKYTLR
jgi:hypothetical protein